MAQTATRRHWLIQLRPLILVGVVTLIIAEIVALSPSSVEEARDLNAPIDPQTLIPNFKKTLAKGIPEDRVPEYTVEKFNYISTHESVKEWNLIADTAYLYNKEKIVHAIHVKAYLFDPDGKATIVTGDEAKYLLVGPKSDKKDSTGERDLEVFGHVKTAFPDGFEVQSEYMKYKPDERIVEIPDSYEAYGHGKDSGGQVLAFRSLGMTYKMGQSEISLHEHVQVSVDKPLDEQEKKENAKKGIAGDSSHTTIDSDHSIIDREKKIAYFTMDPARPLAERFVFVHQPTLDSKGRRGELNYGDRSTESSSKLLHYITLYDDVLLREKGEGELRYATSGRADFDGTKDLVILTEFPQVYEGGDTAVGDRILLHRDTDVVEVENSNSFSQGSQGSQTSSNPSKEKPGK